MKNLNLNSPLTASPLVLADTSHIRGVSGDPFLNEAICAGFSLDSLSTNYYRVQTNKTFRVFAKLIVSFNNFLHFLKFNSLHSLASKFFAFFFSYLRSVSGGILQGLPKIKHQVKLFFVRKLLTLSECEKSFKFSHFVNHWTFNAKLREGAGAY